MICKKCGTRNRDKNRFCGNCGALLNAETNKDTNVAPDETKNARAKHRLIPKRIFLIAAALAAVCIVGYLLLWGVAPKQGNISGNIINDGIAARQGSWVYYLGKDNAIYRSRINNTRKMKICDDESRYLNVVGNWVYYCNGSDIGRLYKVRTDGTERIKISDDTCRFIYVVNDWVYYIKVSADGSSPLCRIRTDGTDWAVLSNDWCFYPNIVGDWIYYATRSGIIYKIHLDGTNKTRIMDCGDSCHYLNISGDWMYYYLNDHKDKDMFRARTDGTEVMKIGYDYPWGINVSGGWVYYINNDKQNMLYKMRTDGSDLTLLTNDMCDYLSIVGDWIYYYSWNEDAYCRIRTNGKNLQIVE